MKDLKTDRLCSKEQRQYAVEAAFLSGFQTETSHFPVTDDEKIKVTGNREELGRLWKLAQSHGQERPKQDVSRRSPVYQLDFRKKQGLESCFAKGMFLKDEDQDFLPDCLDVKLILPDDADSWITEAACNLAFRLGMETTAFEGSILAEENYKGNAVIFQKADTAEMVLKEQGDVCRVIIRGSGRELVTFVARVCEIFPLTDAWRNWKDVLADFVDDLTLRGADGQLAALEARRRESPGDYCLYGSPEIEESQKDFFDGVSFLNYKAGKKVYEKTYELPWEVKVFEEILRQQVYPRLEPGCRVEIEGALSEPKEVRRKMSENIKTICE